MTIQLWGKELETWVLNWKKLEEVWYWWKKVRPIWPQPRMHDWELWFWVNVKVDGAVFSIPTLSLFYSADYDWDISVDGGDPIRARRIVNWSQVFIDLTRWEHLIKITPHNEITVWWAKSMGSAYNASWSTNINALEFKLLYLPLFAFQGVLNGAISMWIYLFKDCTTLISTPIEIKFPDGLSKTPGALFNSARRWCRYLKEINTKLTFPTPITSVGDNAFYSAWDDCFRLVSASINLDFWGTVKKFGDSFLNNAFANCHSLESISNNFSFDEQASYWAFAFYQMFTNCKKLSSNEPSSLLTFPKDVWEHSLRNCFYWTQIQPTQPSPWSSVAIKRNS